MLGDGSGGEYTLVKKDKHEFVKEDKNLIIPKNYNSEISIIETERAIKFIKDYFEKSLAENLNLTRISAPLFVMENTGVNDSLNGVERPVSFDALDIKEDNLEIVQSLAKWKRIALSNYGFEVDEGIYTDMNAIRRDEILDNTHSIYVDQWDWEKIISKEQRSEVYLKDVVNKIYTTFKETERIVCERYSHIKPMLPENIYFITSQQLEDMYPDVDSDTREKLITKEKGAVFISKIGKVLNSGERHGTRSPDYDDWELNGDIIFWYPILDKPLELSSMGIRVDENSLLKQLKINGCEDRKELEYHKMLLNKKLPYTIGGGIGQSRICMYFLRKAHIGEVQASIWNKEMIKKCKENNIELL